jgi:hypothetical protein
MLVLYGKLGYELLTDDSRLESSFTGLLSDIAEAVTAIHLQMPGGEAINDIKYVRQERDNLFFVSDAILYRFHISGTFVCRITSPEVIRVAGYLVYPQAKQLIVLGNKDDIYYYSYTGELLDRKKASGRIQSVAMHGRSIWTIEENLRLDSSTRQLCLEKQAVKYDASFLKAEAYKLSPAALTHKPVSPSFLDIELAIAEDTGSAYAYSPPFTPGHLLQDTLLLRRRQVAPGRPLRDGEMPVYPLRFGRRYWLSSYRNAADPTQNYTFCFDCDSSKSWQLTEGFKDNFYHTGHISNLQAIDACGNAYCYHKQGVVFIVRLKG